MSKINLQNRYPRCVGFSSKGSINIIIILIVLLLGTVGVIYFLTKAQPQPPTEMNEEETAMENPTSASADLNSTGTESTSPVTENPDVLDLTLTPDSSWVEKSECGIAFKIPSSAESSFDYENSSRGGNFPDTCVISYLIGNNPNWSSTTEQYIVVVVHSNYDGRSRREFYRQRGHGLGFLEGLKNQIYLGAQEFKAGDNLGLQLNWNWHTRSAIDPNFSEPYSIYLLTEDNIFVEVRDGVGRELEAEDDTIKMFLTSLNL